MLKDRFEQITPLVKRRPLPALEPVPKGTAILRVILKSAFAGKALHQGRMPEL